MRLGYLEPRIVTKPWGVETWEIQGKDFVVKYIRLLRGHKTSYQYHVKKEEINFIRSGEAEVWLEDDTGVIQKYVLQANDSFFVAANRKHRVIAITDLEMMEVSNEFIDDVVRIEDEFGRGNGRIESEHKTPAVLIFTAGLGSRLKHHTIHKNKALVPIGNVAAITRIIDKFPKNYDFIIAVGYEKESLKEYCQLAHSDLKITFVEVKDWNDPETNPGHTIWQCKEWLQRPFYLVAPDSLIDIDAPHIDGNWIGIYPTDFPEKYATVKTVGDLVEEVSEKGERGHDNAFIGLAAVFNYDIFWKELDESEGHRLVDAWKDPNKYPTLRSKNLKWFDVGNLDDLESARRHFNEIPISSPKSLDEVTYRIKNRVLKFHPDPKISKNRFVRGQILGHLAPRNLVCTDHFIAYDWKIGNNLYQLDNPIPVYHKFLDLLSNSFDYSSKSFAPELCDKFYRQKTLERTVLFAKYYGDRYLTESFVINGISYPSLNEILKKIDWDFINQNPLYSKFHGDLHFDNIIYDGKDSFTYVDWRESFAGSTEGGDFYYDLGKMYAGSLFSFELLKNDEAVSLKEGISTVSFNYPIDLRLKEFLPQLEKWALTNSYNLNHIRLIAALAFLNISPLHGNTWGKTLFFKSIEMLNGHISEKL